MLHVNFTPMSTSIEVEVFFDPFDDLPTSVSITVFDQNGNQLQTSGNLEDINPIALFPGLQPETRYYFQVCTITETEAGENIGCSAWNAYSAQTLPPAPPPPPPPTPTITITGAQAVPNMLYQDGSIWTLVYNGINVFWASSVPVFTIDVEMKSGSTSKGLNIGSSAAPATSGSTGVVAVPKLGLTYTVTVRGQFGSNNWTPYSQGVQVTAANNFHSLRSFLAWSGVSGSKGIRHFLATLPKNLRAIMGI